MADFQLRFHRSEIHELSDNYVYRSDALIKNEIGPAARRRGWFTRAEFIEVVHWKAPRVATRAAAANTAEAIEEVTRVALGARTEELRIWAPQALTLGRLADRLRTPPLRSRGAVPGSGRLASSRTGHDWGHVIQRSPATVRRSRRNDRRLRSGRRWTPRRRTCRRPTLE